MSATEIEVEEEITEITTVSLKTQVLHKQLPVFSTLSSISTMYAAQDVYKLVILALMAMIDNGLNDVASDGEDSNRQRPTAIFFNIVIWGLPMLTIIANSVLRYFSALKVADFLKSLREQKSWKAYVPLLPYLFFAVPTTISDTTINVAMSATLKEEWPSSAIMIESLLSFIFLLPLNIYGIYILHERLKLVYDRYTTGDDKKLLSRRLEAIFYELKNLSKDKQTDKLWNPLVCEQDGSSINQQIELPYDYINAFGQADLKNLAERYCELENLPDGSSWRSSVVTGISILFSLLAGVATMRSPYIFYTNTCNFLTPVAWTLSSISGITKAAFYMSSYDNIMWCAKHYNRLFGSAPVLYGIGAALMAISAAGFWEVAQHALAVISDSSTWWVILSEIIIFLAGAVANMSGAASLAILKMEENRLAAIGAEPDLATAFKEKSSEVLKLRLGLVDQELEPLLYEDSAQPPVEPQNERSSVAATLGSWFRACLPSSSEWNTGNVSCSFFPNPDSNRRRSLLPSIIPGLFPRGSSL